MKLICGLIKICLTKYEGEDSGILYFFKYGDRMFFESFTSDDVRVLELINKDSFFNATLN